MRQALGKRLNRNSGLAIGIPNKQDLNGILAGNSPQVNMTIDHTDPHIGEVGSLLVSPRTVGTVEKEQQVQDQIFSK